MAHLYKPLSNGGGFDTEPPNVVLFKLNQSFLQGLMETHKDSSLCVDVVDQ